VGRSVDAPATRLPSCDDRTVTVRPVSRSHLLRALADLAARPHPGSAEIAAALELPRAPTASEHTDLFDFQVYPYASVHLGEEGMLGGDARDRIAGFLRALDVTPPPEPDHLVVLLHAYADLTDLAASGAPRADHARRVLLHEHLGSWVGRFLARVVELGAEPLRAWARLLAATLAAELAQHGPPPELPPALRDAQSLPEPEDATAADWTQGLLTPVRSGLVIARADLARAARDLELGTRVGERAFTLRALLDQDARAVLGWIATEADRQADDLALVSATGGEEVATWWRQRLAATSGLLARRLEGGP
jgi:TorA maturation chaperone TorD